MLTGENGILTQAQNAKLATRAGAVEEAKDLWKNEQEMDKSTGSKTAGSLDELLAELQEQGLLTEEEVAEIKETGEVTIYKEPIVFGKAALTLVEMFKNGESCDKQDGTCTDETHLHIGDYVNYKNPTSGECNIAGETSGVDYYQVYSVENNDLNWRVLGIEVDEEGKEKLKLIADSPAKRLGIKESEEGEIITQDVGPYFDIKGAEAYVYAPDEMDKIGKIFLNSNLADDARSMNINDINKALGITSDGQIKEKNFLAMQGALQYKDTYGPFESQWTPEDWLKEGQPTSTVQDEVTGYAYVIDMGGLPSELQDVALTVENPRLKSMLFDNVEYGTGKAYWLASRGAYAYSDGSYACFGPGFVYTGGGVTGAGVGYGAFVSNGGEGDTSDYAAVRPVVILKSDITVDEIQKIADEADSWDV